MPDLKERLIEHYENVIDALMQTIENRASDGVLDREVDGVKLRYASPEKLFSMLETYTNLLDKAENDGAFPMPGQVLMVFRGGK